MPDIFITHSTQESAMAHQVQQYLHSHGATAFLAPFSIQPGAKWSDVILANLAQSRVVLFLASRAACSSPYVNQELGGSLALNKRIVPVIWDISPDELPGWTKQYQAVDLRKGFNDLGPVLDSIVQSLQLDKDREGIAFLLMIGGLLWLCSDE